MLACVCGLYVAVRRRRSQPNPPHPGPPQALRLGLDPLSLEIPIMELSKIVRGKKRRVTMYTLDNRQVHANPHTRVESELRAQTLTPRSVSPVDYVRV